MHRAIITGLGSRGMHWVRSLRNHAECEIVGYVEPQEAKRQQAIAEEQIPARAIFENLDQALRAVEADFVMDVTPPAQHHVIAQKAFSAGLHVLGEKPLSDNYTQARQVVETGKRSNKKHMLTQNYRFSAHPRTTRQLLAGNLIGTPGQCDIRFYIPWADIPGSHYVTEPYMLMNDMMVHHFDLMRYVLAENPTAVTAITWNQPWGWHQGDAAHAIVFEYASGLRATHVACGCAVGSQTGWNGDWRIEGPQGTISWDSTSIRHAHLHRTEEPFDQEIPLLQVPPAEEAILNEFFTAIKDNREPECSAADNLGSLAMVFAAIESAKSGRKVQLSELASAAC